MSDVQLPLSTRPKTYGLLVGVVVGLLVLGLAIPMAFGERDDGLVVSGNDDDFDLAALDDDSSAGPTDGGETLTPDGTGAAVDGSDPSAPGSNGANTPGGPGSIDPSAAAPGSAPGASAGSTGPLTASDIGVTPTSIKVGLLVPTSDAVGSTEDQSTIQVAEFQAFIDQINDGGGINGRTVEVAVANYDVLDQDAGARAACLELTEDHKVFAVFNTTGFGPPGALCITREKGTPFLQGSGHPDEVYAQANGLYSSSFDSQTRNYRNMVGTLEKLGVLKGKKIGLLGTEWIGLRREQEEGIVHTLQALGYDPFVYWLSGDPVSSQSQIPIAVQQMKSNGVEVLALTPDFISGESFVQQANAQRYTPRYVSADPWGYSTDYVTTNYPDTFEGSITVTAMRTYDARVNVPEPAVDAACRTTFEKSSGIKLDRANDPNALYVGTMWACGVVQRFERTALAVGPDLTRAGFGQVLARTRTVDVPYAGGPATFGPQKLDGANHYRPQQWKANCKCWHPLVPQFTLGTYT